MFIKEAGILNRKRERAPALFAVAAGFLLATPLAPPTARPEPESHEAVVTAQAFSFGDGKRVRIGSLEFLGGWILHSPDSRVGGISAFKVAGGAVTAATDSGHLLRFPWPTRDGRYPLHVVTLGSGAGKENRDAESMVVAGDEALVGFERVNGIGRFRIGDGRRLDWVTPDSLAAWPANRGAEAMVRLRDGRWLVLAEGAPGAETSEAILFDRDPLSPAAEAVRLFYRPPPGFRVTDADVLADGRLLVLHRRFGWTEGLKASLAILDIGTPEEGATLQGREIARLGPPHAVDNMEGLSIAVEQRRTLVRLASDNNFTKIQRTLLLEFALIE